MSMLKALAVVLLMSIGPAVDAAALQPEPPKGFVAVDEVPPGEQIPAINLVAAAYGFVWITLFAYVWSVGRRLQKVEADLGELEAKRK
jgi:CcmD family protein